MRNDRLFIQTFAIVAVFATATCVWQENPFGAVVFLIIATALLFISRNIGHLIRCYRTEMRLFRIMRQLTCLMRENNVCNSGAFHDLSEIIDALDRIEDEMHLRVE